MSVFKKKYTIAIPDGAERFRRGGVEWVRWKDRAGRRREGRITTGKNGTERVLVEATTYTAKYRDAAGVVCVVSTGCKDRTAALAVLAELEKRAEKVKSGIISAAEDAVAGHAREALDEHIEAYCEWLGGRGCVAQHVKDRRSTLTGIAVACGFSHLTDVSRAVLEKHLANRRRDGEGHVTSNRHRAAWVAFCNWAVRDGRLSVNPVAGIPKCNEKVDQRRNRRALSLDELQRLIEATRTRPLRDTATVRRGTRKGEVFAELRAGTRQRLIELGEMRALFYRLLAYTGLRFSEARSLRCSNVVLETRQPHIVLHARHEKNRQGARIALQADLARELASHIKRLEGSAAGPARRSGNVLAFGAPGDDPALFDVPLKMTKVFDRDLRAAGIPKRDRQGHTLDIHCLRHTFATMLCQAGVPLQVAQRAMRHSDPKLTAGIYTHLDLNDLGAAVAALPSLDAHVERASSAEIGARSLAPTLAPTADFSCQKAASHGATVPDRQLKGRGKHRSGIGNNDKAFHELATSGGEKEWRARRDLNARHPTPEAGALSN